MLLRLKYCLLIAAAALICTQTALSQTKARAVINLRDFGWETPEPLHRRELDAVSGNSIVIDHQGQIIVGFPVRERSGLVTREQPALTFRVLRFTPDGKVNLSLSLPANGWRNNSIYLSDADQIIVRANDRLQLLQSGLDSKTGNGSWTTLAPCDLRCQIFQSPSRRTLLLYTSDVYPPVNVIDLSKLSAVQRCERSPYPIQSITDKFAYYSGQNRQLEVFTYRWPLCDYEHHVELPIQIPAPFTVVNDDRFITNIDYKADKFNNSHLYVISSDGHPKFQQAMAKHEFWDNFFAPIRSSEQGNRIAVDMLTMRGGNQRLDLSAHVTARRIVVYDIDAGKALASIPVSPTHHYRYEFDFSPDGHRLAILEDDVVKVVDIE